MNPIPWYKSNTLRGLVIAALAQLTQMLGITETTTSEDITGAVDKLLDVVSLAATAYAAWARTRQPTPPVTLTQAAADAQSAQGGFARPLMLALLLAIAVPATLVLSGCASLGMPAPQTFNERLAAGYVSATSIRMSATTLLNGSVITSGDAENLQKQADVAREGLDIARALPALQAEDKLQATLVILQAAQTYLCGKNPTDPNCAR